jgi:type IV pilus assembly protein PilM
MAERVLGLDVGTSSVRVVEVVLSSPPTVSRVGEVPLPPGAVRDGEVVDAAAVGAAITELWRQTGLRSRDVRVGLSGPRVVVRVIEMPAMPDDELAGAIRFSASDHIPIPLDEVVLDHAVLETLPPAELGGAPTVRVLIAGAYRSSLDGLLTAVTAGGLRAAAVDLVPFALVRALAGPPSNDPPVSTGDGPPPPPPAAEALVSVGAGLTTVIVHEGGRPRFVRTVAAGGDMLTTAIGDELGVSPEAAEEAKRTVPADHGDDDDLARRAARIVELRLTGILGEIQSSLAYWMAQSDRPLQRVVLTGGGVRAGDVAGRLALLVGVPVEAGTVRGLEAPERALGSGDWADLTVAAGLALGGSRAGGWHVDLCPPQKRKLQFDRQLVTRLGAVAAILVVALGGLTVKSVLATRQTRSQLSAQQKAVRGVEAELARYDSLRRLNADLDAGRKRVQTALGGDVSWTRFLSDFVQAMPDGVWIQSLSAQTTGSAAAGAKPAAKASKKSAGTAAGPSGIGSVAWTVTGLDYPQASDWLRDLKEDPALAGVTIGSVTKSELGGRSVVLFSSTATLTEAARSDRAARLAKAAL